MADVFEEVEEQLRSARYVTIIRKGWPWVAGLVVLALLATFAVWGWRTYQANESAAASQAYQAGMEALTKRDTAAADKSFAAAAKSSSKGYAALALMQQAGLRSAENKTAEAVKLLDEAARVAPEPMLADAARLKAAYLVFDTASLADLEGRLTPLTDAKRPYFNLAREALAMKRLALGQTQPARQALQAVGLQEGASQGMQMRAQIAQGVIASGQAGDVAAVAKAAATVPPDQVRAYQIKAMQEAQAAQAAQAQAQAGAPGAGGPPPQSQPGAPQ